MPNNNETRAYGSIRKYKRFGACGVILGMAALSLSMNPNVAHADEKVNPNPATNAIPLQDNPTANATESQKKTGTEKGSLDVTVSHDKLDKAVEEAKTAGVTVVEAPAKEKTVASDKIEEAKKEVEADYKAQETKVKEATDKYKEEVAKRDGKVKIVEKINKEKEAKYQADLAEVKKKEEALKAKGVFVDNDQVTVYGKLDESKRGSLDYYSDLSVVFKNKENNLETVKGGLGATSKTTLELVDKIKYDTARDNLAGVSANTTNGHYLTGIEKGSTFILHNVGETNSGKTISAKFTSVSTPNQIFPQGGVNKDGNTALKVRWDENKIKAGGKSDIGFDMYNYLNVEWDIEYFDEATGKPLNLGTASIYADIDYAQYLRHTYNTEDNVGTVINPTDSKVVEVTRHGKTHWMGVKTGDSWSYDDPTGLNQYKAGDPGYINVHDVEATPEGTLLSIGAGHKHNIRYYASDYVRTFTESQVANYRRYSDAEQAKKGLPPYTDKELFENGYTFELWGGSSVVKTIVVPPKPEYDAIPGKVDPPKVNVQYTNLKTNVKIEKHVKNSKGEDVNNHSVPKLAEVVWELEAKPLAAGREKTTKLGYVDDLPKGYQLNLEKVKAQNSEFDITYNSATHSLTASVKEAGLEKANKDLNKPYTIPTLKLYGTVMNDAATYTNNYHLNVNNKFDVYSNTVTVTTPGDPDRPKDSKIKPVKVNYNKDKVKIDGKQVLAGSVNYYHINLDYDQYKGIKSGPDAIQKGFGAVDDYPEQALDLLPNEIKYVETESGKEVKGITAYQFKSIDEVKDAKVKAILESSKIKPKGAFQVFVADDAQSYYDNYVSKGISVTVIDPMRVKSAFSGNYENKAYQIDFGNGYEADLVKNNVVTPDPHKKNLNSKGVDINGKSVLAGTVNHYHVTADYSKYKGIVVEKDRLAKGLFVVDDYPEEAVDIETNNIKIVDSKGKAVEGVTSKVYKSLAEAPKLVQDALREQGYAPKGAFQVFTPNNMEDYFKKYVVTGETLTYIVPMKVKAEMAKTGGKYENTAYQLDFGSAKVTETVVNTVPKLETKKDVIIKVGDTESKDGKEIALGQKFYYSFDGSVITANRAEELFEYKFVDDYQETHDRFDGVYKVIAKKDFKTADGKEFKKGDDLTSYSFLKEDKKQGKLEVGLKEEFLRSITNDSEFQAEVFVEMTRIMSGEVENKQTHVVNGVEVESNTVKTTTPTPPTPETPTPKPQTPAKKVLPNTGADASVLGIVMAGITSALGAIGLKRKRD